MDLCQHLMFLLLQLRQLQPGWCKAIFNRQTRHRALDDIVLAVSADPLGVQLLVFVGHCEFCVVEVDQLGNTSHVRKCGQPHNIGLVEVLGTYYTTKDWPVACFIFEGVNGSQRSVSLPHLLSLELFFLLSAVSQVFLILKALYST